MPRGNFYGWRLLGVLWLVAVPALAFPAFGVPVVHAYMVQDLHLDRALAGLPHSIFTIMSGLPGPLVALSILRIGVRGTMVVGGLFTLLGALSMAFLVSGIVGAVIASGVLLGLGAIAAGPIGAQPAVAEWFTRRRAFALSLLHSAGGAGGFVAAPLLDRVITRFDGDWRVGWLVVACLAVVGITLAALFVRERPVDLGQLPDGEPAQVSNAAARPTPKFVTTEPWTSRDVVRSPSFGAMLISGVGVSAGFMLFMSHGLLHLQELGHSPAAAAWSVSIFTAVGLLTQPLLLVLGHRIDVRYLWSATLAIFGVGLVLNVDATTSASLYLPAICLGSAFASGFVCMMAVLSNYFGVRAFPTVSGIAAAFNTTVGAVAPVLAGWLYDKVGGYGPAFYTAAALCVAGAVVLFLLRRPVLGRRGGMGSLPGPAAPEASTDGLP